MRRRKLRPWSSVFKVALYVSQNRAKTITLKMEEQKYIKIARMQCLLLQELSFLSVRLR